jgi:hypothetical protein
MSAFGAAKASILNVRSDVTNSLQTWNFRAGDGVHLLAILLQELLGHTLKAGLATERSLKVVADTFAGSSDAAGIQIAFT